MDFAIDQDVSLLLAAVADFFKRRDDAPAIAAAAATGPAADRARWSALCELGLPAFRVGEPIGMGAGMLATVALAEYVGAVLLPEPALSSAVLAKLWADHDGAPEVLNGLLDGSRVLQFAPFNRVQLAKTVSGAIFVVDDGITDVITAPAVSTDGVPAMVLLERRRLPQVTRRHDVDPARPAERYQLDGVVPLQTLPLDAQILGAARRDMAVLTAAELVGGMQAVLTATIDYVQNRRQFGRSIGSFQAVKHRLADMFIAVEQARAAVQFAAIECDEASDTAPSDTAAAARWVPRSAIELFDTAIHLHGAMGYSWELGIHLHLRRALATRELLDRWCTMS